MSNQYIGEIRAFGFNFAPLSWAFCNGQSIAIDQNAALFQILGTTYGGNGQTNFQLPDLQDLTTVSMGQGLGLRNWPLGQVFGEPAHTLIIGEVPQHGHTLTAGTVGPTEYVGTPTTASYPGKGKSGEAYSTAHNVIMGASAVGLYGGSLPHENIQPVQVLNFCIALYGVFPTQ